MNLCLRMSGQLKQRDSMNPGSGEREITVGADTARGAVVSCLRTLQH